MSDLPGIQPIRLPLVPCFIRLRRSAVPYLLAVAWHGTEPRPWKLHLRGDMRRWLQLRIRSMRRWESHQWGWVQLKMYNRAWMGLHPR